MFYNDGDIYIYDAYVYSYSEEENGWKVQLCTELVKNIMTEQFKVPYSGKVVTINEESYPSILESINGIPITNMNATFECCSSMEFAPDIPKGVTSMRNTFVTCASLISAPQIPDGVTDMSDTFFGCDSLVTAPEIPMNVKYMGGTFSECTSLSGEIIINVKELINYESCFESVDMSKITLKGEASNEILNLLGNTGENYTNID